MAVIRRIWNSPDEGAAYDTHVHTTASDALISPKDLAKYLNKKHISCAVTDHNVISGVKKTLEYADIIPGIEISASEGPHLLVYFERYSDLETYYLDKIRDKRTLCPHLATKLGTEEIIDSAKNAGGFVVAAHPYGYGIAVRGVMKGIATGVLPESAADNLDGLEVLCSGLTQGCNRCAENFAAEHNLCMTGGSDAHVLWDTGFSVSVGSAGARPSEMLEEIRQKKTRVAGMERNFARKAVQGLCMTPLYIPWLFPLLYTHMQQHILRIKSMMK